MYVLMLQGDFALIVRGDGSLVYRLGRSDLDFAIETLDRLNNPGADE